MAVYIFHGQGGREKGKNHSITPENGLPNASCVNSLQLFSITVFCYCSYVSVTMVIIYDNSVPNFQFCNIRRI